MKHLRQYIDEYFKTQSNEIQQHIVELVNKITVDDMKDNVELFGALVPPQGKADTLAGEILRSVHRIGYRYFNDGDHYFEGAGIGTSGSNAYYLSQHTNQIISNFILETAPINYIAQGDGYDASFETLLRLITMFLTKTPQLFLTRNTIDSTYNYTTQAKDVFEEYDLLLNGTEEGF